MSRRCALMVLVMAMLAGACGGSEGTLESDDLGIVGFHDFSGGNDKSFGIFVCAEGGDVELESVEAMSTEGEIEFLGGLVYESAAGFVGADNGFPPEILAGAETTEIDRATVTTDCDDATPEARTQVVVGVRRTGGGGGIIEGVRINHGNGSLEVGEYVIILCGDELEHCEDFAPEG